MKHTKEYWKEWYKSETRKKWLKVNRLRINKYMRDYRKLKPLTEKQKRHNQNKKKKLRMDKKKKLIKLFGGKCSICGYNKCNAALDFHHTNSKEKEMTIAEISLKNVSYNKILKEARKCILICSNCHREIHNNS